MIRLMTSKRSAGFSQAWGVLQEFYESNPEKVDLSGPTSYFGVSSQLPNQRHAPSQIPPTSSLLRSLRPIDPNPLFHPLIPRHQRKSTYRIPRRSISNPKWIPVRPHNIIPQRVVCGKARLGDGLDVEGKEFGGDFVALFDGLGV